MQQALASKQEELLRVVAYLKVLPPGQRHHGKYQLFHEILDRLGGPCRKFAQTLLLVTAASEIDLPLVAQTARCHRDARCDSNRTAPNRQRWEKVCSLAMRAPLRLISIHTGKEAQKLPQKSCDVGLRCWRVMLACDAKYRHLFLDRATRNACGGLACDASTRDAKSLAMWVERCKPLKICHYVTHRRSVNGRYLVSQP